MSLLAARNLALIIESATSTRSCVPPPTFRAEAQSPASLLAVSPLLSESPVPQHRLPLAHLYTPDSASAIRAEGKVTINNGGDFDGNPQDNSDDALIYAGAGFTINNNPVLPVQIDADGNPLRSGAGRPILVDRAVAPGYSVSNTPNNQYANLLPPQVVDKQTVSLPAYADVKQQELTRRIPPITATVTFNAQQILDGVNGRV